MASTHAAVAADGAAAEACDVPINGCSFIIKSRVLQDDINFSQLENEQRLPSTLRDCTVFLLPLQLPNEGIKMSRLRQLLTDEARCLDSDAGNRVWRLLVDASTVLTKLVQLGFSFSAASIHPTDNVYTWTVVGTDDDEEEENARRAAADRKRKASGNSTVSVQRGLPNGSRMPLRNVVIYSHPQSQPNVVDNAVIPAVKGGVEREIIINNKSGRPIGQLKLHAMPQRSVVQPQKSAGVGASKARMLQSCSNITIGKSFGASSDLPAEKQPNNIGRTQRSTSHATAQPAGDDDVGILPNSNDGNDAGFGDENDINSIGGNEDDVTSINSDADYSNDAAATKKYHSSSSKKAKVSGDTYDERARAVAVTRASVVAKKSVAPLSSGKKTVTIIQPPPGASAIDASAVAGTTAEKKSNGPERKSRLESCISAAAVAKDKCTVTVIERRETRNAKMNSEAAAASAKATAVNTAEGDIEGHDEEIVDSKEEGDPYKLETSNKASKLPKPPAEPVCEVTTPNYISYKDDCIVLGEPPFEREIDFNRFTELKETYLFTHRYPNRLRDYARQVLLLAIPHNEAAIYEAPYYASNEIDDRSTSSYERVPEPFLKAIENLVAEGWQEVSRICSLNTSKPDDPSAVAPVTFIPPTIRNVRQMIEQYFQQAQKHPLRAEKLRKDRQVWNRTMRERREQREAETELRKQKVAEVLTGQQPSPSSNKKGKSAAKPRVVKKKGKRKNMFASGDDDEEDAEFTLSEEEERRE